jgi:hypothetical protein
VVQAPGSSVPTRQQSGYWLRSGTLAARTQEMSTPKPCLCSNAGPLTQTSVNYGVTARLERAAQVRWMTAVSASEPMYTSAMEARIQSCQRLGMCLLFAHDHDARAGGGSAHRRQVCRDRLA